MPPRGRMSHSSRGPARVIRLARVRGRMDDPESSFRRVPPPRPARTVEPMAHTALTPVFVGLRTGLHVLFAALTVLVDRARDRSSRRNRSDLVIAISAVLLLTYGFGGVVARPPECADAPSTPRGHSSADRPVDLARGAHARVGRAAVAGPRGRLPRVPDVLPLPALPRRDWSGRGDPGRDDRRDLRTRVHSGWTVGGVVGPLRRRRRRTPDRPRLPGARSRGRGAGGPLVAELLATRDRLAGTEHESGLLAERARLAREIHDTVAQGLSSIQMLLHAAERADARGRASSTSGLLARLPPRTSPSAPLHPGAHPTRRSTTRDSAALAAPSAETQRSTARPRGARARPRLRRAADGPADRPASDRAGCDRERHPARARDAATVS